MSSPRILVEGGPVDVRSKHLVAALVGLVVGLTVAIIVLFTVALHAAHDAHIAIQTVKKSRIEATERTCREANERHATAQTGIEALARRVTSPRAEGLATVRRQREEINAFVNALVPSYDCAVRVRELTRP